MTPNRIYLVNEVIQLAAKINLNVNSNSQFLGIYTQDGIFLRGFEFHVHKGPFEVVQCINADDFDKWVERRNAKLCERTT